jgi:kanamycin kinase
VQLLGRARPASESLVVCHGDYCLPNVLLEGGDVAGFVDLGELGVADRWWDLAVATWSLAWNLGGGHEALFLAEYGAEPDPARMAFYRLLYDVVS